MSSRSPSPPSALRVALAAGGTGGHLMPALACAEALSRRVRAEFLVIGSTRESERRIRGLLPYPVVEVEARALVGAGLLGKLRGMAALVPAIGAARRHLRAFRPHLVVATGGYVCGPTGIAAWLSRVPLLVLEQNAEPGLTTRWLRRFARKIGVSFESTAGRLGRKAVLTGNPLRATLPRAPRRDGVAAPARSDRGVRLLILGGSQGARGLNAMVELALPFLARSGVGLTITHQSGQQDLETLRTAYAGVGLPAQVTPFIREMGNAYADADLVCTRAGATTVAELAYCGLPSILVPFPAAAARHQHANADALARAGAAVIVEEQCNGKPLAEAILALAEDHARRAEMAAAAAACGHDDAADRVAELALSCIDPELAARAALARDPRNTTEPAEAT